MHSLGKSSFSLLMSSQIQSIVCTPVYLNILVGLAPNNIWCIEVALWMCAAKWQLRFSTTSSSIAHGIGRKRCVKLLFLSIMRLNKHLQIRVLLSHAAASDETTVRNHPYASWVSSNWRTTLPPLALLGRYRSITTPVPTSAPALQYAACNYSTSCCYPMTPRSLHAQRHSTHTCLYCNCVWFVVCVCSCMHVPMCINAEHVLRLHVMCHFITYESSLLLHVQKRKGIDCKRCFPITGWNLRLPVLQIYR